MRLVSAPARWEARVLVERHVLALVARSDGTDHRTTGAAVECGGLENRFGPLGPTRVQIPPPPLLPRKLAPHAGLRPIGNADLQSTLVRGSPLIRVLTGERLANGTGPIGTLGSRP